MKSKNQLINIDLKNNINLTIKREDLLHPIISGNKIRKLKYNIQEALNNKHQGIITFGGAYSNHIVASAYAAKMNELKSIGIIRGEELETKTLNQTLCDAKKYGMQLIFVNRDDYRKKNQKEYTDHLKLKYPNYFIIPEGGTNVLAIKGCEEILTEEDKKFDYICTAVGTGGTISGIINASNCNQKILGFSVLNEDYLENEIRNYTSKTNWQIIRDFNLGGYAKINEEFIIFLNEFYKNFQIPLDPIYTGKMVYGILKMINNNFFEPNCKILIIHTGGLQGIKGINDHLKKTSTLQIIYDK